MTSSLAVKIMTRLAMPPQKQRTCLRWRRKGKGGGKQNQTSWAHTMLCLWLRAARKQLWSRGGIERGGEYGWSLAAGAKVSFLPPRSQSHFTEGLYVICGWWKTLFSSVESRKRWREAWIEKCLSEQQRDPSRTRLCAITWTSSPSELCYVFCIRLMIVSSWKASTQQMSAHRLFGRRLHLLQVSRGKGHENNVH